LFYGKNNDFSVRCVFFAKKKFCATLPHLDRNVQRKFRIRWKKKYGFKKYLFVLKRANENSDLYQKSHKNGIYKKSFNTYFYRIRYLFLPWVERERIDKHRIDLI